MFPLLEFSGEDHTVSHLLLAKQSDISDLALRVGLLGRDPSLRVAGSWPPRGCGTEGCSALYPEGYQLWPHTQSLSHPFFTLTVERPIAAKAY